jgi:hypothetical protein
MQTVPDNAVLHLQPLTNSAAIVAGIVRTGFKKGYAVSAAFPVTIKTAIVSPMRGLFLKSHRL